MTGRRPQLRIALFGSPLSHSRSKDLFERVAAHGGPSVSYEPVVVDAAGLASGIEAVRARRLDGANVTIPHKIAAARATDRLSPAARRIGAVNVLHRDREGRVLGDNTDSLGFARALARFVPGVDPGSALLLGTGGAARAVADSLAQAGWSTTFVSRTPRGAGTIGWGAEDLAQTVARSSLVVQATPVGTAGWPASPLSFPFEALGPGQIVIDLVYSPWQTEFLQQARCRGARGLNGWPMLVEQAAAALDLWWGEGAGNAVIAAAEEIEPRDPAAGSV